MVTYFRLLNNVASNKKKLDEFESKWTNLQTTFLHGGLDIIGELKEKLNGLINQFEGFKNKSEEQFGELKAGNPKTQYFFLSYSNFEFYRFKSEATWYLSKLFKNREESIGTKVETWRRKF